jgi:PAS domain S-box-containing protein
MSSLGSYIKERREALSAKHSGYSIRSVAKRIGIHHSYLSKLERGENAPLTEERIHALARLLGEDSEVLMAMAGKLSERTTAIIRSDPAAFRESLAALERRSVQTVDSSTQRLNQRKNELEELTRLLRDEIRQRQILEGQLREQQKVQSTILENLRDVSVVLLDTQFRVVWSNTPVTENPSSLLHQLGAGNCGRLGPDGSEANPYCTAWRALKTKTVQNGTYGTADGRHWLLRSAPVLAADGSVLQIVHLQFEVTELLQARQALEASEERWKFALEGSRGAVWDYDIPTGRVQHSPMWMAMLGYAGNEFELTIGQWERMLHPDDRGPAMDTLAAHVRGETEFYDFEYRLLCKDGSFKWIHSRGKLMEKGATGAATRITGTHHDMSQRKAIEEQILANEAFLETLLGSIEEGISVLAPDMTVRYANPTMVRWYGEGFNPVGKKCHQAFHQLGECCARCPAVRSLRTGRNEFEVLEVTSATSVRSIEFSAYPIKDVAGGEVTGVIVFVRDITAKRQARTPLTEGDAHLQDLFEAAPVGICSVDAAGRFLRMNARYARLHGYASARQMMRSVHLESETFAEPSGWAALRDRIRAGHEVAGFECRIRRKDGTTVRTSRSVRVSRGDRGELQGWDVFLDEARVGEAPEPGAGDAE